MYYVVSIDYEQLEYRYKNIKSKTMSLDVSLVFIIAWPENKKSNNNEFNPSWSKWQPSIAIAKKEGFKQTVKISEISLNSFVQNHNSDTQKTFIYNTLEEIPNTFQEIIDDNAEYFI